MSLKSMDLLSPFPKSVPWLTPSRETIAQVVRYTHPMEANGCQKCNQVIK